MYLLLNIKQTVTQTFLTNHNPAVLPEFFQNTI